MQTCRHAMWSDKKPGLNIKTCRHVACTAHALHVALQRASVAAAFQSPNFANQRVTHTGPPAPRDTGPLFQSHRIAGGTALSKFSWPQTAVPARQSDRSLGSTGGVGICGSCAAGAGPARQPGRACPLQAVSRPCIACFARAASARRCWWWCDNIATVGAAAKSSLSTAAFTAFTAAASTAACQCIVGGAELTLCKDWSYCKNAFTFQAFSREDGATECRQQQV